MLVESRHLGFTITEELTRGMSNENSSQVYFLALGNYVNYSKLPFGARALAELGKDIPAIPMKLQL